MASVVTDSSSGVAPSKLARTRRSRQPASARSEASMKVSLPPSALLDRLAISTTRAPTPTSATVMKYRPRRTPPLADVDEVPALADAAVRGVVDATHVHRPRRAAQARRAAGEIAVEADGAAQ